MQTQQTVGINTALPTGAESEGADSRHTVHHGVESDRQIDYWLLTPSQPQGSYQRIPMAARASVSVVEPACTEFEVMKNKFAIESECRHHAEEYAFKVGAA